MFHSIPSFYLLCVSNTYPLVGKIKNGSRHCKMSSGEQNFPPLRTTDVNNQISMELVKATFSHHQIGSYL